ncbi:MAG TPA: HAMP domain-containing sensor histidine kinase [Candidatus Paceibacterota bacterium]|nr:HAMP domain-containing sensor histidine kinase [Candidatus Paceibacterota bacterium]
MIYTHIPTALVALLFGGFLFYRSRTLQSTTFFIVCGLFAVWCLLDISTWFAFLGSRHMMFTWSLLDLVGLGFFFFSYYFLYTFSTKRDLPLIQKIIGLLLLAPTAIWTFLGDNLSAYDANTCEAIERTKITNYPYIAEGLFLIAVVVFVIVQMRKLKNPTEKKETVLAGTGVFLFLLFFYSATLLVNFLVTDTALQYAYNYEIYGLFGMPILLVYLGRLILKYKAFNLRVFSAQLLVIATVVLLGSQFAFLTTKASILLNTGTLVLVAIVGVYLVKGVRREIEARKHIEVLAKQLEQSNASLGEANNKLKSLDKLKTEFLSLASHQLRSPLTAIKGYASMLDEGAFGKLNSEQDTGVKRIYSSAQGLVNLVEDLLNVSKIEQGGMKYEMMATDLAKTVIDLAAEMKIPAESKKLSLVVIVPKHETFMAIADPVKIQQVFLNLVDNSIKYTPSGSITIELKHVPGNKIAFSVSDTGMGLTPETKSTLFQKFARGEGAKVNTGGSGLGLYLVNEIVKAHKGQIDVFSEGLGKGTTFTVLLPAAGIKAENGYNQPV